MTTTFRSLRCENIYRNGPLELWRAIFFFDFVKIVKEIIKTSIFRG